MKLLYVATYLSIISFPAATVPVILRIAYIIRSYTKSHYAPRKPLYLNHLEENIQKFAGKKIGLICMDEVPVAEQVFRTVYLSKSGDMQEAARNLFAALRTLDQSDVDIILAAPAPEEGLGRAINDRLRRAAVPAN